MTQSGHRGARNLTRKQFPRLNTDGSFTVIGTLTADTPSVNALSIELAYWLVSDWMPRNQVWTWSGRTGPGLSVNADKTLHYADDFSAPPEPFSSEGGSLMLRLKGKASSKFWRDWLVLRLFPDIQKRFPTITGVADIQNEEHV